ncbi:MAG: hypothetical protein P2976_08975 [Gemmatimonadota bacterium]|nr:hypothetical protein [Gemmatimonadota bacterium]
MIYLGDARLVIFGLLAVLAVLGLVWFGLRLAGVRVQSLLTPREWRLAAKLLAILGMAFLLYQTHLARDLPAELFLYGRF